MTATRFKTRNRKRLKTAPTGVLKPGSAPKSAKNGAEIRQSTGSTTDHKRSPPPITIVGGSRGRCILTGLTGRAPKLEAPAPPIYEGGSAPCNPLRRSSPLATLLLSSWRLGTESQLSLRSLAASASDFVFAKVPGPRRSAGADFASLYLPHGSRRHACCLGTMGECGWLLEAARQHITFIPPAGPGSKRTSRRAPMALRSARLAAADYGNGRRRCPQALPVA